MSGIVHRNNALKDKTIASNVLMGNGSDKDDTVESRITSLEAGNSTVKVATLLNDGVHIANISVNGNVSRIYAPEGGGGGDVTDVEVDGTSVVDENGVAQITMPSVPSDLNDLSDVNASSPSDGQALIYDNGTGKWIPGEAGQVDDVKVNGTSVVDNNKTAQIKSYKELTQAQYDALPDTKYTDGILYCIKDSGIVEGEQFAPIIYSLEERQVGTWTDGKPLYQKTLTFTPSSSDYTIDLSSLNIENIVSGFGYWTRLDGSYYTQYPIQGRNETPSYGSYDINVRYAPEKTLRVIINGYTLSQVNSIRYTIQYTKTTDVPGSGSWGTDGVPMVHYDGNEKIVGTWFGETLYEKTFEYQVTSTIGEGRTILYSFPNVNVKKIDTVAINNSTGTVYHIPFADNSQTNIVYTDGNITIRVTNDTWGTNYKFAITLQYTKTS